MLFKLSDADAVPPSLVLAVTVGEPCAFFSCWRGGFSSTMQSQSETSFNSSQLALVAQPWLGFNFGLDQTKIEEDGRATSGQSSRHVAVRHGNGYSQFPGTNESMIDTSDHLVGRVIGGLLDLRVLFRFASFAAIGKIQRKLARNVAKRVEVHKYAQYNAQLQGII